VSQPLGHARLAIGLALVLLGLGVAAFAVLGKSRQLPPTNVPGEPASVEPSQPGPSATNVAAKPPSPEPEAKPKQKLDREASDRMRTQIEQSLAQRTGSPAPRASDPASPRGDSAPAAEAPTLDREYIRERIKEDLLPVAIECYESALADEPELGGKLVMHFAILGEPEVGGVVDDAVIVEDQSTLANEFLRECMRESMMAVNFDAPPDGGRVEVTYPFEFEPGEDE
jgi:hypothetical protein